MQNLWRKPKYGKKAIKEHFPWKAKQRMSIKFDDFIELIF